jgi:ech hydrogenase subunit D
MPNLTEKQTVEVITTDELLDRARGMHSQGWRLAQIGAANMPGHLEVNYSFGLDEQLATLRLQLPGEEPTVPSISSVYWCAVLYENETHDLFRLKVEGMAVDFQGKFYQTAVLYPFGSRKAPSAKPAAAPKPVLPAMPTPAALGVPARELAATR